MEARTQSQRLNPATFQASSQRHRRYIEEDQILGIADAVHVGTAWDDAEPLELPDLNIEFRSLGTNGDIRSFVASEESRPNKRGMLVLVET
jgi:hypothetical protein